MMNCAWHWQIVRGPRVTQFTQQHGDIEAATEFRRQRLGASKLRFQRPARISDRTT
jgi:hypothetical protein